MEKDEEYKVGPGRPPREHQFKKNESGNPGGKKKGTLNLKTLFMQVLTAEVTTKNGKKITVAQAIVHKQAQEAMGGKQRAAESLLARLERYAADTPDNAEDLHEDDEAILRRLGYRAEGGTSSDSGAGEDDDE